MTTKFKGFTLIELLVVVAIIAVLVMVGIAIYSGVQKNARDTKRKGDISAISKALEGRNTTGSYEVINPSWFINPGEQGQLLKDPMDPDSTGCNGNPCKYCFRDGAGLCATDSPTTNTPGSTYTVCANLEAGGYYCISNQQ